MQRQPGESPNDHSDRAIRRAAEWYQVQLGDAVEVLLLTNDVDNKQKAIASGLKAQSIHAYVRSLPEADELQDLLVNTAAEAEAGGGGGGGGGGVRVKKGSARYKAHLPMSELTRGVAAGELHQGKLHVNRHNPQQGYVSVRGLQGHSEVLLQDRDAMNRAVEGDTVVLRLLPQAEWRLAAKRGEKLGDQATPEADELAVESAGSQKVEIFAADKGDEEEQRKFELAPAAAAAAGGGGGGAAASGGTRACGAVVGIVKRNWRPYVCVLDPESAMGSQVLPLTLTLTLTLTQPWARRWNRPGLQHPTPLPNP